jgi:hypothetical protein
MSDNPLGGLPQEFLDEIAKQAEALLAEGEEVLDKILALLASGQELEAVFALSFLDEEQARILLTVAVKRLSEHDLASQANKAWGLPPAF